MAEPTLIFIYNKTTNEVPYASAPGDYGVITPGSDLVVFTGGGIDDTDKGMGSTTLLSGTRSSTIRPAVTSYVIPYTYVESGATMYYTPSAGHNIYRYVFGVVVSGTINSQLYLEAWDDNSFSSYDLPVLSGTSDSGFESYVNAITTTLAEPPWAPGWDGGTANAAFLRGSGDRVGLKLGSSSLTDEEVYFNIYIRLEADSPTFHNTPVLGFRYLYT